MATQSFAIQAYAPISSVGHILAHATLQTNDVPMLQIWAGLTSGTRVWQFTAAGDVLPENSLATTATRGFLYITGGAGPPTGTPANAASGIVPLYFDTSGNALYAYDGSWLSAAFT